ncbi:MAG TPA: hypothetical protein VIJ15_14870 [Dermatophilaceae bacterium]
MRAVVTSGTGTGANLPGTTVFGKTGTAEHGSGKNRPPTPGSRPSAATSRWLWSSKTPGSVRPQPSRSQPASLARSVTDRCRASGISGISGISASPRAPRRPRRPEPATGPW